jgi:hypothetical protein
MSMTVALCLAVGLLVGQAFRAPAQVEKAPVPRAAVRWEYKIVDQTLDMDNLNKQGNDGWELVFIGKAESPFQIPQIVYKRVKQ